MTTQYLIARDETGTIIAKRASNHAYNEYAYATARGPRSDLRLFTIEPRKEI
jgi:hypothetical protein